MLIPFNVDVPMDRWPWANWAIIAVTIVASFALFVADGDSSVLVLDRRHPSVAQYVGYMYGHAGVLHLVGNMVFLFCFGNAVNAKLGHLAYVGLYHGLGVLAGLAWVLTGNGLYLVGASGAIMGVVGIFVVLFPLNDVRLFYWFGFVAAGTFELSAYVVIGAYVAFDLWGLLTGGGGGVAFVSHLAGAAAGFAAAALLVRAGVVRSTEHEKNLLEVWGMAA